MIMCGGTWLRGTGLLAGLMGRRFLLVLSSQLVLHVNLFNAFQMPPIHKEALLYIEK